MSQAPENSKQQKRKENQKKKKKTNQKANVLPDLLGTDKLEFVKHRIDRFEEIYRKQEEKRADLPDEEITVTLPDGRIESALKNKTTPLDIAKRISEGLARRTVIAKVNDELFDSFRPLEGDCKLELLDFHHPEGREVFWHSSAHVLGQTLERLFEGKLTIGPALEDCFYYDVDTGERTLSQADYDAIDKLTAKIVKEKQPFQRIEMTKQEAVEMFRENRFKQEILDQNIGDDDIITAYRCGPLIDLCRGPHIPHTGVVKAMRVHKHAACYWKGKQNNPQLQRVYGISFPDKKLMKQHLFRLKEAEKRNHRNIGLHQKLFFFHHLSPGCGFWLPHGTIIYNKLMDFIKDEYRERGYTEVMSPNVFNMDLWETSGHAAKYRENMFIFDVEGQEFGMKPMNCPGHCLMFGHELRSYRDLPIRYADFGVLHRNELSGALSGLTRVRRFCQDDAHIFCMLSQVKQEINSCLDFVNRVYGIFGFKFNVSLSTRPDNFMGEIEMWDRAEVALAECLNEFGQEWKGNPHDGAFYGPKIDIELLDALDRKHQCATIQLDFQLPERFQLHYASQDGVPSRPVIVHRAILGSVERFIAILTEHCAGKWPFWISPRQCVVLNVSDKHLEYARFVREQIHNAGYHVELDDSNNRINRKIRDAQLAPFNFILVVGQEEIESNTVNVRTRDNEVHGKKSLPELLDWFKDLEDSFK